MFWILLVALIICTILYLSYRELATIEYLILGATILVLGSVFTLIINHAEFSNSKYFKSGRVITTKYYPYWVEEYQQAHTVCHSCGKSTCCHTYYTTEYMKHYPYWTIHDTLGQSWEVSKKVHNEVKSEFKSHQITTKEHKATHGGYFHSGDPYVYVYKNETNSYRYPTTKIEGWYNPIKNSKSLFNTKDKEADEVQYPIQTWRHGTNRLNSNLKLSITNYDLDKFNTKLYERCKANLIITPVQDIKECEKIEGLWAKGGKNDLVVCVSGSLEKPNKVKVFGWSNDFYVQRALESYVVTKGIKKSNLSEINDLISANFAEKDFSIYKYVAKNVPFWVYLILIGLLSIVITLLVAMFLDNNIDKN